MAAIVEASALTHRTQTSAWPDGRPFALFLSHDIDQIHDRELFRILADINHIRRLLLNHERGSLGHAARRVMRALTRPKCAEADFQTILDLEGRHSFRSTWFLLHDHYWARHGSRYSFVCPEIQAICRRLLAAKGELGIHGGYYRFNNPVLYRDSIDAVEQHFGVRPAGIRNHLLRFSVPDTWRAQQQAGLVYDATYAQPRHLGPLENHHFPFYAYDPQPGHPINILEFPITIMDATVFRYHQLSGQAALDAAWSAIAPTIAAGGLVSLLWHNNYFNEPEYRDWQMVYEKLLEKLALRNPWCATGKEINDWWRAQHPFASPVPQR